MDGRERPLVLIADVLLTVGSPNLQSNRRLLSHSIVQVAQETIEESLLKSEGFIARECLPFLPSVREQPFFSRGYPRKSFKRSARVQPLIRPTRAHQGRHVDIFEDRPLRGPVFIV